MARLQSDAIAPGLEALVAGIAGIDSLRGGDPAYVVGGAVRDALLGVPQGDVDVVVEGDAAATARRLDPRAVIHDRFGTARARVGESSIDIAAARAESYAGPGSLPEVRPATIAEDLGRRDFSINAMAVPLTGAAELVDPQRGKADLDAGLLRILHAGSFSDDPTRALRAARYAARFGFRLEAGSAELIRACDPEMVSADRIEAELRRIAAERDPATALMLLGEWRIATTSRDRELVDELVALRPYGRWRDLGSDTDAILAAAGVRCGRYRAPDSELERGRELGAIEPLSASSGVAAARGHTPTELRLARAAGAEWIDRYLDEWRTVRLEIDGADLLDGGVEEGPAVGRGLAAALGAKLDGEVRGRAEELELALDAARA